MGMIDNNEFGILPIILIASLLILILAGGYYLFYV